MIDANNYLKDMNSDDYLLIMVDDQGDKRYYKDTDTKRQLHRTLGPAIETADGSEFWYLNGKLHRKNGPAVIKRWNGTVIYEAWYWHGLTHREDGPACTTTAGAYWYKNGILHRQGGPACEYSNGGYAYYFNGQLHRDINEGPARYHIGEETLLGEIDDVYETFEYVEYNRLIKQTITLVGSDK